MGAWQDQLEIVGARAVGSNIIPNAASKKRPGRVVLAGRKWGRACIREIIWLLESPSWGCKSTLLPDLLYLSPSMQLVTVPEVRFRLNLLVFLFPVLSCLSSFILRFVQKVHSLQFSSITASFQAQPSLTSATIGSGHKF